MLFSPAVGLTNTFVLGESSPARTFDFIAWYSVVTEMARRAGASPAHCRHLCTITGRRVRAVAREGPPPPLPRARGCARYWPRDRRRRPRRRFFGRGPRAAVAAIGRARACGVEQGPDCAMPQESVCRRRDRRARPRA